MNKKILITIIILVVAAVVGYMQLGNDGENRELPEEEQNSEESGEMTNGGGENMMQEGEEPMEEPEPVGGPAGPSKQVTITYTDEGFSPEDVEINQGDSVLFVNESSRVVWPASDIHPTHTVYPGTDIKSCFDGSDHTALFDSCGEIAPGDSWSFIFQEAGAWDYHDHKKANEGGTITVNEKPEGSL